MDVSKKGLLGIHPPINGGKGYVLTHLATGRAVLLSRLKRDAQEARRALEDLDWSDLEEVRGRVDALRGSV